MQQPGNFVSRDTSGSRSASCWRRRAGSGRIVGPEKAQVPCPKTILLQCTPPPSGCSPRQSTGASGRQRGVASARAGTSKSMSSVLVVEERHDDPLPLFCCQMRVANKAERRLEVAIVAYPPSTVDGMASRVEDVIHFATGQGGRPPGLDGKRVGESGMPEAGHRARDREHYHRHARRPGRQPAGLGTNLIQSHSAILGEERTWQACRREIASPVQVILRQILGRPFERWHGCTSTTTSRLIADWPARRGSQPTPGMGRHPNSTVPAKVAILGCEGAFRAELQTQAKQLSV